MRTIRNTKGAPLPDAQREQLASLVGRVGEREVIALVGFNKQTLYRAIAGLPVYAGTAALVRERLAAQHPAGQREVAQVLVEARP